MMEQSQPRKRHRHVIFIAGRDYIVIAHGSTRLCHVFHAALVGTLNVVAKREKRIGTKRHVFHLVQPCPLLLPREHVRLHFERIFPNAIRVYPPDAVVTTTTTVDTTQKQPKRIERDSRNDFADVDGFYDSID